LQVRDRTVVELVRSALAGSGVAPSHLVLEITEGVLIDKPDVPTSVSATLPVDNLKIDKNFVAAFAPPVVGSSGMQGFPFARPAPAEAPTSFLAQAK
jgi:EAL domain-containing protein (putative c-di-GMP-specific phosphodiesterase class I)